MIKLFKSRKKTWVDATGKIEHRLDKSPQGSSPHSPINDKKALTLVKKVKLMKNKQKFQAIKIKISPLVIWY